MKSFRIVRRVEITSFCTRYLRDIKDVVNDIGGYDVFNYEHPMDLLPSSFGTKENGV